MSKRVIENCDQCSSICEGLDDYTWCRLCSDPEGPVGKLPDKGIPDDCPLPKAPDIIKLERENAELKKILTEACAHADDAKRCLGWETMPGRLHLSLDALFGALEGVKDEH